MSSLIFGVTRIVSLLQEQTGHPHRVMDEFLTAYDQLRRAYPNGNLRIHLSVEETSEQTKERKANEQHAT